MSIEVSASLRARAAVHAALGDPHRLAIVEHLALSDRSPSELADRLRLESNLLAHHLNVLDEAGLIDRVVSDGDRRRRYLRLRGANVATLIDPGAVAARNVVFVCTQNSARSQLAAALWNHTHPVPATSAGTQPAARVHPRAVEAGAAVGLDLRDSVPRPIGALDIEADLVITVCDRAHEDLPAVGTTALHWSIPDPARDGRRTAFDATVHRLRDRIADVGPAVAPARG